MHTPPKPSNMPMMAKGGSLSPLTAKIITIHSGKMAPMMEPRPLLIYCTPQVLRPLLSIKFKKLSTKMGHHCFPLGQAVFLYIKNSTYKPPPINCRIPASCRAGIAFTPCREASQVVPQKKLTQHSAKMGSPMLSALRLVALIKLCLDINIVTY